MRRTINNLISVIYSFFRFGIMKIWNGKGFSFHWIERFSPNVVVEINHGAKVCFGKSVRVHSGSKLKVRSNANLKIEANVRINYNCIIACHEDIYIGEGTEFGPSVYVYDHDHDYKVGLERNEFKTASVKIGKNCWIGANSIILRGTELGDNCIVAAGTVLKGKIPANSLVYQKRDTEIKEFIIEEDGISK